MHPMSYSMNHRGMGAPVTHVISSHRALKKQQNSDIWVSIETFKHALQTIFSYINKFTGLTDKMIKVVNNKNQKFD